MTDSKPLGMKNTARPVGRPSPMTPYQQALVREAAAEIRIAALEDAIEKIHWYWEDWRQTEEPIRGHTTRIFCEAAVPRFCATEGSQDG
jgi:hypothetical protein